MSRVVIFCVLVCTLAIASHGYEFDDPTFNEYLATDLEDVYSSAYSSPRHRREIKSSAVDLDKCPPPQRRRPQLCCAQEVIDNIFEGQRDVKTACFKEISGKDRPPRPPKMGPFDPFNCDNVKKHRQDMICIFHCFGQKMNLVDEDGNLKEAAITKYIKDILSQVAYLAPVQDRIISSCISQAKNVTAMRDTSESSCNPVAVKIEHCIFKEIQLNCPAEEIEDKEACTRLQNRLKKGDDFIGMHHGPPPPPPPPGSQEIRDKNFI